MSAIVVVVEISDLGKLFQRLRLAARPLPHSASRIRGTPHDGLVVEFPAQPVDAG